MHDIYILFIPTNKGSNAFESINQMIDSIDKIFQLLNDEQFIKYLATQEYDTESVKIDLKDVNISSTINKYLKIPKINLII